MVDWDALVVGPTVGIFGEAVAYAPSPESVIYTGADFEVSGVFDDGYAAVGTITDPGVTSSMPRLGVRLSLMPAGYDPANAQGDMFTVLRTGKSYVVKMGQADSHGWARLDCNERTL